MKFKKKLFGSPIVNQHIAEITGQHYHHRPYAWVRGDQNFSHITGGMVLPSFDQPGYLMVMGVRYETDGYIDCLVDFESSNERELIKKAQAIQKEYGDGVIKNWWGNPAELMSLVNEMNIDSNPVLIAPHIDSDQNDYFQICIARISVALRMNSKTLKINRCNFFKRDMELFVKNKTAKSDLYPSLAVVGGLLHTILILRPWEHARESYELIPTIHEDYAIYEQKKTMSLLEKELYE